MEKQEMMECLNDQTLMCYSCLGTTSMHLMAPNDFQMALGQERYVIVLRIT